MAGSVPAALEKVSLGLGMEGRAATLPPRTASRAGDGRSKAHASAQCSLGSSEESTANPASGRLPGGGCLW